MIFRFLGRGGDQAMAHNAKVGLVDAHTSQTNQSSMDDVL